MVSQFFRFMFLWALMQTPYGTVATPSGSSGTTVQQSYDELFFVVQLPGSYCNTGVPEIRCYNPIPNRVTVKGLWPQQNGRSVRCNSPILSTKLDRQQIALHTNLLYYMEYYWPNLNSLTPRDFLWLHEFKYHGSCILDFSNQVDYFISTLRIAINVVDETQKLFYSGRTGFLPGTTYLINDLKQAIFAQTNLITRLRCNIDMHGTHQLKEIVFCADKNQKLKNCTFHVTGCPNRLFQFSKSSATRHTTSYPTGEL